MNQIADALDRLTAATGLPDVLDAAYGAFEDILAVLRRHQEDDETAFPAFVLAAAAAANGRDWIAAADSLPPGAPRSQAGSLLENTAIAEVARAVAALSSDLAARLTAAATTAPAGDQQCCERAAAEAATITALLGGANPS